MRKILLLFMGSCILINSYGALKGDNTDILQRTATQIDWTSIKAPVYPSYDERSFWNNLPQNWQEQYLEAGEKYLEYSWPAVTATRYLRFMQDGDRASMQSIHYERSGALKSLVLAELVEGEGRFLNSIIDGVFAICEQTSWCNSAHLDLQKAKGSLPDVTEHIIDLGAVDMGECLSMIHYFFKEEFDEVNPFLLQCTRFSI